MYKILRAQKDAYVTDRVIDGVRKRSSNTGRANSLDLFKLYGHTSSGSTANIELSRLLVKFDLQPIRDLVTAGEINVTSAAFSCDLKLFDVYGGQPTPDNFTVVVYPLSRSFDEGIGKDVVLYGDTDVCNFLSGSRAQGAWLMSGCGTGGGLPGNVDYVTSSTVILAGAQLSASQLFVTGEEDLDIDVTTIVSATLANLLPDQGFRIALSSSHEDDTRTYFVKRFGARTAFNESKRPRLVVRYDDSVLDDTLSLTFNASGTMFLYNYGQNALTNLTSGSTLTQLTSSNCVALKLRTEISGGFYDTAFTGSQHTIGTNVVTGTYSASVYLSSFNATIASKLATSGSVDFTPIWQSLDGTVGFLTGSKVTVNLPTTSQKVRAPSGLVLTVTDIVSTYKSTDIALLRLNIFDHTSPTIKLVNTPVVLPGNVIRNVYYRVRDIVTDEVVVPFDTDLHSTRVSSDGDGMFFKIDMSNLTVGKTFVIDVLVSMGGTERTYRDVSSTFTVTSS